MIYLIFIIESTNCISGFDDDLPKKEFVLTFIFSPSEWQRIQPHEIVYKDKSRPMKSFRSYHVLPKGSWTPILAEHFWEHTNFPCCLSFKRAKVFAEGNVYICVIGKCSICDSHFKGIVKEKPSENSRFVLVVNLLNKYFILFINI